MNLYSIFFNDLNAYHLDPRVIGSKNAIGIRVVSSLAYGALSL